MKKKFSFICVVVLATLFGSAYAQEDCVSLGRNNWFISLGGGGSLLMAEQDREGDIPKEIRYTGEISIGKWFTPFFGARIAGNYGALRGFNTYPESIMDMWRKAHPEQTAGVDYQKWLFDGTDRGKFKLLPGQDDVAIPKGAWTGTEWARWRDWKGMATIEDLPYYAGYSSKNYGPGFWQDFKYAFGTIDLMMNLSNLFTGCQKMHRFDIMPFLGIGIAYAFEGNANYSNLTYVWKLGSRFAYNFTPHWALYFEPQLGIVDEEFDGFYSLESRSEELVAHATIGIQYTFNRKYISCGGGAGLTPAEKEYLINKINENRALIDENRDLIEGQQTIQERQQALLRDLDDRVDDHEKRIKTLEDQPKYNGPRIPGIEGDYLPEFVRFDLDSYKIRKSEQPKIDEAIRYLNEHPKSKLLVVGYADVQTAYPAYNMKLSEKRAKAVAAQMVARGISANRLIIEWKGDTEQPYEVNEWNRVVIFVAR
ncbi:MAG: OmpA family protein [Candidatus Symbiothrix sp.]|jgi:outer membrane protein OmpA-like peptidoglycan-associated protein|nr:OmpA family protein [Candidatus Symbiothrix sp.]